MPTNKPAWLDQILPATTKHESSTQVAAGRRAGLSCKTIQDMRDCIRQCVKCGGCQATCPTYRYSQKEGQVARGKLALASSFLAGDGTMDSDLAEDMSMCLMCGTCEATCPSHLPIPQVVGAMRRELAEQSGLSRLGKSVSQVISSPHLAKLVKGGAMLSPLLFKKIERGSGLHLRFPLSQMKERTLPSIPFNNLFDRVGEFCEGDGKKPLVGFFAGCAITYLYPEIGEAMVRILQGLGYSVYLPRAQKCCGIPALTSGAGKVVEDLAEKNIRAFAGQGEEYIITACASCRSGVGEYYKSMGAEAASFSEKVIDFNVFLSETELPERLASMAKKQTRRRVVYHDPCHLKNAGITDAPRKLLALLPHIDFIEMDDASLCCGLGGTFSARHYEASKAIGEKKMEGLRRSGAGQIVTCCPGCIIQLQDVINHARLDDEAVHLLSLVAEALRDG